MNKMADLPDNGSNNHKKASSKIISIESTADGDIQTVVETEANANDSVKAFTHHLRDSWDDTLDNGGGDGSSGGNARSKTTQHKQNLSVQFLDFSISGDVEAERTLNGADVEGNEEQLNEQTFNNDKSSDKETIESTAAYYFDTPNTSASLEENRSNEEGGATGSNNDDKTNFFNNIRSSWGEDDRQSSSGSGHKGATPSVQFLDSTISEYSDDVPLKQESSEMDEREKGSTTPNWGHKGATPSVQFLDSTVMEYADDLPSNQSTEQEEVVVATKTTATATIEAFEPPASKIPQQRRLGTDSPISPRTEAEQTDIVVPMPVRPTNNGGGVSRKHRRVFSGRSNPAMVHRRVNTRGDKCAPEKEFKIEGLDGNDRGQDEQERGGKKAFGMASYEQPLQPMSPATVAMPPPIPTQQVQPPPPLPQQPPVPPQYPGYYHGTPPPSYDPYNFSSQAPPPQPSYHYGTPPPQAPYYNASPQSDAGVNYNVHRSSPVFSGYPPQAQAPQQQHPQSAPVNTQPPGQPYGRQISDPPPQYLAQPTLDEDHPLSPKSEKVHEKIHTDEKLFEKSSSQGHKKEPSFNPLPYEDSGHHRKQSSLGDFLATTALFDDDIFDEDEGYASAPEEGDMDKHSHKQTLSSMSFMRSLSSDNFLRQISSEEAAAEAAAQATQSQQWQPQQQPPPLHPYTASPMPSPSMSGGYPMQSTSPVVSQGPPPPPMPGTSPGFPPTPPGYYQHAQYGGTPPQYGGTPPQYGGTPPHAQAMWSQQPPPPHMPPPNLQQSPQQPVQYIQPTYHYPQQGMPPQQLQQPVIPPQQHQYCQPAPEAKATKAQAEGKAEEKRPRRKCSVPECPNRVVQGGLCIAHGAKRKTCNHPGCTKNVKKAGMCSTHGPARKRCEFPGCPKVAVQGGKCIAHGAKKKVCSIEECTKQAILGGMCKKHYDEVNGVVKTRAPRRKAGQKKEEQKQQAAVDDVETNDGKKGHERGLSLFQDDDLIETIVNNVATTPPAENDGLHGLSI